MTAGRLTADYKPEAEQRSLGARVADETRKSQRSEALDDAAVQSSTDDREVTFSLRGQQHWLGAQCFYICAEHVHKCIWPSAESGDRALWRGQRRPHDIFGMLAIEDDAAVIAQHGTAGRGHQQVAPPVVPGVRWRLARGDESDGGFVKHHCITGRDVLGETGGKSGWTDERRRQADAVERLVHQDLPRAVERRTVDAVELGHRPGELLRQPDIILIGKGDEGMICRCPQEGHETLGHAEIAGWLRHPDGATAVPGAQLCGGAVGRSVIPPVEDPVGMSLRGQAVEKSVEVALAVVGRQKDGDESFRFFLQKEALSYPGEPSTASTVRARLSRHGGSVTPKVWASLPVSSRESAGRCAGVGQSAVAMASTSGKGPS